MLSNAENGRLREPETAVFRFEKLEATTGFEPVMGVLQTPALPLGYVAVSACRFNTNPPGGTRADAAESACGAEEEI